nr:CPBP family intramembrane metalloprotease [Akkermansiaceae bacterium]
MRLLRSDVTKLLLYLISCFLLAALLTPWLYNAGTFLGEVTEKESVNPVIDWVGKHARKADFPDFFKRSLLISALLLFVPLVFSLKLRNEPAPLRDSPWSVYLPGHTLVRAQGQPLRNPKLGWLQLLTGFLLAGGLLFGMGWVFLSMEWFSLKEPIPWEKAWRKSVGPAITASLLEEIVFRGVLLGICLRTFRPSVAITVVSLLFAALHFLQPPDDVAVFARGEPGPEGAMFIDPNSGISGFQMLL